MNKKVFILDSTLRDGAQAEGVAFSVEDKLSIVTALDELGIDYIEAGNPGSNPKDLEFFKRAGGLKLNHSKLVAFGATRRKDIAAAEDGNVKALMSAGTAAVAIFGKCWDHHATEVLGCTLEENLEMIRDTVSFFKQSGKEVTFDAEHFFDGYKHNPEYALKALESAHDAGADFLALCDTNGGCFPDEVQAIVTAAVKRLPGARLGIHCHNDSGCAVASSIMAVRAGAVQVQGTYLGFGERCGNANLSTIIPDLQLKLNYTCIPDEKMPMLTSAARAVAEICNLSIKRGEPYVGVSAFAHKAGMHMDGVLKSSKSFEHIDPESVGNSRRFLMSEMAGRRAIISKIEKVLPGINKESKELIGLIAHLKELEHNGYQFDGAEGSFDILVLRHMGLFKPSFELISYKILDEKPYDDGRSATATLKIRVGDTVKIAAADGDGPVNALDKALREALSEFYPELTKCRLIDYKVRVMEPKDATAATVRVLITSTDGSDIWTTVGVSPDIIDASFKALVDSVEYTLRSIN